MEASPLDGEYRVWIQPVKEDKYFCEHSDSYWINLERLEQTLTRLIKGPSMMFWQRIWVTDRLDCIVFDWNKKEGIIFPPTKKKKEEEEIDESI